MIRVLWLQKEPACSSSPGDQLHQCGHSWDFHLPAITQGPDHLQPNQLSSSRCSPARDVQKINGTGQPWTTLIGPVIKNVIVSFCCSLMHFLFFTLRKTSNKLAPCWEDNLLLIDTARPTEATVCSKNFPLGNKSTPVRQVYLSTSWSYHELLQMFIIAKSLPAALKKCIATVTMNPFQTVAHYSYF